MGKRKLLYASKQVASWRPRAKSASRQLVIGDEQLARSLKGLKRATYNSRRVAVGDRITLFSLAERFQYQCQIVEAESASPEECCISYLSPLGAEAVGRCVGETLVVDIFGRRHVFYLIELKKDRSVPVVSPNDHRLSDLTSDLLSERMREI